MNTTRRTFVGITAAAALLPGQEANQIEAAPRGPYQQPFDTGEDRHTFDSRPQEGYVGPIGSSEWKALFGETLIDKLKPQQAQAQQR